MTHVWSSAAAPRPGVDDTPLTGLDALLINGRDPGAAHRTQARAALARQRQREQRGALAPACLPAREAAIPAQPVTPDGRDVRRRQALRWLLAEPASGGEP